MPDYKNIADTSLSSALLTQRAQGETAEQVKSTTPAVQTEAVDRVVCRLGDASCAAAHATAISRSAGHDHASRQRSIMRLQQQYGNRYVGQVLSRAAADRDNAIETNSAVERSIDGARGGGQALDSAVRPNMESAFGANFGEVRVHHDSRADVLSRSLNAKAFTTGRDIFFRQGAYSPGTSTGRELLAHELTHVVQQNGSAVSRKMSVSQPGDRHELEADQMARTVMQREQSGSTEADRKVIARQNDDERHVHTKADSECCQRQPEAPKDEEKKKVARMMDQTGISPQADDDQAPPAS